MMMTKTSSHGQATGWQIGRITAQARAWGIDRFRLLAWLKSRGADSLATLSHADAKELIDSGLAKLRTEQSESLASGVDKGMIRNMAFKNGVIFSDLERAIGKNSNDWTNADCRQARELIRRHVATASPVRAFDAAKAERDYHETYGSKGA